MSSLPRLSVITPSYNQAAFLEMTLRSVLRQDYPNLEYMVIDGASTDGSVAIIERYASQLAWWVSEQDQGQADAINKGFARATGEIVAWINSDDVYLQGTLHKAVEALQAHPQWVMVHGNMLSIDAHSQVTNEQVFGDWGLDGLMRFQIIGQPTVFMRRKALAKAGFLDAKFNLLLDNQLWLRIAQSGPIGHLPQLWAAARYHPGAKNVAQAAKYGLEAHELDRWMQSQPELADRYWKNVRRIHAGLYCYEAHYLLDGGLPRQALSAYLHGLASHPATALKYWRRIAYILAGVFVNTNNRRERYLEQRKRRYARYQSLLEYLQ